MTRPKYPDALIAWLDMNDDQRYEYEERAAILEYDGNMPRTLAEAEALRQHTQWKRSPR